MIANNERVHSRVKGNHGAALYMGGANGGEAGKADKILAGLSVDRIKGNARGNFRSRFHSAIAGWGDCVHDRLDTLAAGLVVLGGGHGNHEAAAAYATEEGIGVNDGTKRTCDPAHQGFRSSPTPEGKLAAKVDEVDPNERDFATIGTVPQHPGQGVLGGLMIEQAGLDVEALAVGQNLAVEILLGVMSAKLFECRIGVERLGSLRGLADEVQIVPRFQERASLDFDGADMGLLGH
jgi:hypothetical protein